MGFEYELLMLNAEQILEYCQENPPDSGQQTLRFDLDPGHRDYGYIVSSLDRYPDNALFYQFQRLFYEKDMQERKPEQRESFPSWSERNWNSASLKESLVFMDCAQAMRLLEACRQQQEEKGKKPSKEENSREQLLGTMFNPKEGITFLFPQGNGLLLERRFVAFDKSSSMARNCCITFIDAAYKDEMDERLLLGLPFRSIPMVLSKFYAYRGLYLTSATRISLREVQNTQDRTDGVTDLPSLAINERTVIVLNDIVKFVFQEKEENGKCIGYPVVTAKESPKTGHWDIFEERGTGIQIKPFDGEGILSTAFADQINQSLGPSHQATSFQIRMPFTKGMLHQVDFHSFYRETLGTCPHLYVKDAFGIQRNLLEAEVILTKSMFKCTDWLKEMKEAGLFRPWEQALGQEEPGASPQSFDPMKLFFQQMHAYHHGLYVSGTSDSYSTGNVVQLNYQFLSPLDMPNETFRTLLENQASRIADIKYSFMDSIHQEEAAEADTDDIPSPKTPVWQKACQINGDFIHDPKVAGIILGLKQSSAADCALGKISVAGECRYLSGDLYAFLLLIVKPLYQGHFQELMRECLRKDRFYLPKPRMKGVTEKRHGRKVYFGFLRNPHLSRNEECALRPYIPSKDSVYTKYFSHLKGVVMTSVYSTCAMTLGGADFDGDLVKVVGEEAVVDAILRGCYKEQEDHSYRRTLPIINIPSTQSKKEIDSGSVTFALIRNTFSNHIGQISNLAVKLAKMEYGNAPAQALNENLCAACTIITGLEIDAVKTGSHPEANIKELWAKAPRDDYFLQIKDKIKDIKAHLFRISWDIHKNKDGTIDYRFKNRTKEYMRLTKGEDPLGRNIDMLPYYGINCLLPMARALEKEERDTKRYTYFTFQTIPGWKNTVDPLKLQKTQALIEAYQKIRLIIRNLNQVKKALQENHFRGHVQTILKSQYDYPDTVLTGTGQTVEDIFLQLYASLKGQPAEKLAQILEQIPKSSWQFAMQDTKNHLLDAWLPMISDDERYLLTQFRNTGYMLLYYMVLDALTGQSETLPDDVLYHMGSNMPDLDALQKSNPYFGALYETYKKQCISKASGQILDGALKKVCREFLMQLFSQSSDALMAVFAARTGNRSGASTFLWDNFNEDEILPLVYRGEKKEKEEKTDAR